uniref:Arrestin_C domain-containing protein n=1 Tax=Rhabditophanes sp. KR3021 TaxID=114890 RepID=A0AC35U153_9BILA
MPISGISKMTSTFDLFSSGSKTVAFQINLFRNVFCLGESIDYTVKVTNIASFGINLLKAKLVRVCHFEANNHSRDAEEILTKNEIPVPVKQNDTQLITFTIPLTISEATLEGNSNIKVLYEIRLVACGGKDGKTNKKAYFVFPVHIAGPRIMAPPQPNGYGFGEQFYNEVQYEGSEADCDEEVFDEEDYDSEDYDSEDYDTEELMSWIMK